MTQKMKKKIGLITSIELGLNFIAQDIFFKHNQKHIKDFIKTFKFYEKKK